MNLEKQNSSNLEKLEKYRREYKLAITLGTIVFVDILLAGAGINIIPSLLYVVLNTFLSQDIVFSIIGFYKISYLIFFIFAIILNRKIKSIEKAEGIKPLDLNPSKGFKTSMKIILIPFGIVFLIGILLNIFN